MYNIVYFLEIELKLIKIQDLFLNLNLNLKILIKLYYIKKISIFKLIKI